MSSVSSSKPPHKKLSSSSSSSKSHRRRSLVTSALPASASAASTAATPSASLSPLVAASADDEHASSSSQISHSGEFARTAVALMDSEAEYFSALRTVVLEFLAPMRAQGLLTERQASEIFLNIEQLLSLSGELLADLSAWCDATRGLLRPSLVPLVRKLAGWLPSFKEYFVNSNVSVIRCAALLERDANVRKFLSKQRAHGELLQLLELPILRLVKYPVLLSQLVKQAPSRRYAQLLGELSDQIETWVEDQVAQNRTDAIGFEQLTRVSDRIDGFDVAVPGRFFVHEGDALVRSGNAAVSVVSSPTAVSTSSAKPSHVFLFNDILVVTTPKTFNKKRYDFKQHVLIDAMTEVRAIASDTSGGYVWFRLQKLDNERAEHDFAVKSNAERVSWLGYLKHIIQQRGGMLTEATAEASVGLTLPGAAGAASAGAAATAATLSSGDLAKAKRSSKSRHSGSHRSSGTSTPTDDPSDDPKARAAYLQIELARIKRELAAAQQAAEHQRAIAQATDELLIDERRINADRIDSLELQLKAERKARRAAEDDRLNTSPDAGAAAIAKLASVAAELEAMRALVDLLIKPTVPKGATAATPAPAAALTSAPTPAVAAFAPPPLPKDAD